MIVLVFNTRAEFDTFKAATPVTDENPFTKIGTPVYETFNPDGTPAANSRCFVAHHFTAEEAEYLQSRGADVRIGDPDGPIFGQE